MVEHEGVKFSAGSGKYNSWHSYFLNPSDEKRDGSNDIFLKKGYYDDVGFYKIYFDVGSCDYYMGLKERTPIYIIAEIKAGDIVIYSTNYTGPIDEETLYEKYDIKIIKKTISQPLVDNVE